MKYIIEKIQLFNKNLKEDHIEEYANHNTHRGQCLLKSIANELGFASLGYQSLDELIKAIGIDPNKVCTYCWTGKE